MRPLPPDFDLFDHTAGPAIGFNGWIVASIAAQDDVSTLGWRIALNPDRPIGRHRSAACRVRAERYMIAWVTKWQASLREMYWQPPTWTLAVAKSPFPRYDDPRRNLRS